MWTTEALLERMQTTAHQGDRALSISINTWFWDSIAAWGVNSNSNKGTKKIPAATAKGKYDQSLVPSSYDSSTTFPLYTASFLCGATSFIFTTVSAFLHNARTPERGQIQSHRCWRCGCCLRSQCFLTRATSRTTWTSRALAAMEMAIMEEMATPAATSALRT